MYTDLWCASFLWGQPGLLTIIGMVERSPCGIVLGKNAARSKLIQAISVGDKAMIQAFCKLFHLFQCRR